MKTIIITGGTRGIGADIALKFLNEGWKVFIAARNKKGLAKDKHENLVFHAMDVRNEYEHNHLVEKVLKSSGHLDCTINCAGFSRWLPINNIDDSFWTEMVDTNLKGTFWGCKAASNSMPTGGCIINISSLAGKRGSANNSVYCATKFGINGITQALAKELGPKGIRVNAICPVYVETPDLLEALAKPNAPPLGKDIRQYLERFSAEHTALKRLPIGSEIADTCFFLASENASAITGQCINVDCGTLPQ